MPSHLVEALFQGIWSSLTGGWFYDNHSSLFINTVHMYTWFFLFALPFSFYIIFPSNFITWLTYTTIISLFFLIVKLFNYQLNRMFDKNKITISEKLIKLPKKKPKKQTDSSHKRKDSTLTTRQAAQLSKTNRVTQRSTNRNNRSFDTHFECDSNTNFNLDSSFNTNSIVKYKKSTSSSSSSSSSSARTNSNRKKSQYYQMKRDRCNQAANIVSFSSLLTSPISSTAYNKQTEQVNLNLVNETSLDRNELNFNYDENDEDSTNKSLGQLNQSKINPMPTKSTKTNKQQRDNSIDTNNRIDSNQKDDWEENSNRSLFKISEESIAQLNNFNTNNHNKSQIPHKSLKVTKKRVNTKSGHVNETSSVHTLKQSSSVPGMDDYCYKESTHLQSSSMSSLNLLDKYQNSIRNNNNKLIYHEAKSDNKLIKTVNKIQFYPLRRAHSDITFDLFEKLIKKHRLKSESESDDPDCLIRNEYQYDQYYEEVDNESTSKKQSKTTNPNSVNSSKMNLTSKLYLKYKTDSENLDKKINKCFNRSKSTELSVVTGAKSFHNLIFSSDLITKSESINLNSINNESSFSLILNQQQSNKISSNLTALLSLSQQLQYQDLKQFKTTLECVELLSKKKFSNKKSKLNIDQTETINIDDLRRKLFLTAPSSKLLNSCLLTREEKEQYEKQGAIPKTSQNNSKPNKTHFTTNRKRLGTNIIKTRPLLTSSSSSSSNSSISDESVQMLTQIQSLPVQKLDDQSRNQTLKTTVQPQTSILWSGSNLHSPVINSRNLTQSASQAASAAVKIIRRDFLDRFTNRNNTTLQPDDIDLPMTSTSSKPEQSLYETFDQNNNINDYDEIGEANDDQKQTDNDYYEEIDDNFYSKNSKINSRLRRRSSNDSLVIDPDKKQTKQVNRYNSNKKEDKSKQSLSPHQFNTRRTQYQRKCLNNSSLNNLDLVMDHDNLIFKHHSSSTTIGTIKPVITGDKNLPILLKKTPINNNTIAKHTPKQNRNHYSVGRTYEEIMQISNSDDQFIAKKDSNANSHYRLINNTKSTSNKRRNHGQSSSYKRPYKHSSSTNNMEVSFSPTSGHIRANSNTLSTNLGMGRLLRHEPHTNKHSRRHNDQSLDVTENLLSLNDLIDSISNDNRNNSLENDSLDNEQNDFNEIDAITPEKPDDLDDEDEQEEVKKKTYKLWLSKSFSVNIPFSHFSLLAMLDKNKSLFELSLSIIVSALVAIFASLILSQQIYDDILMIMFCFIVASCHYSLLKSVQPDSASPIHGFNSLTALSRPIYFCIVCSVVLLLRVWCNREESLIVHIDKFSLYGYGFTESHLKWVLTITETFLLFLPVVFTLGLFPQVNTFIICILEQIDMYLFGGTAMNNLPGAILSLVRSLFTVIFLAGVLFGSIYTIPNVFINSYEVKTLNNSIKYINSPSSLAAAHNQFSQSVLFSVFSGLLVLVSYFLSRQSSDLLIYFNILKQCLFNCSQPVKKNIIDEPLSTPLLIGANTENISMKTITNISVEDETKQSQHKQDFLSVVESSDSCNPSSPPSSFASSTSTPCLSTDTSPKFPAETGNITTLKTIIPNTDIEISSAIEINDVKTNQTLKKDESVTDIDFNEDPIEKKTKQIVKNRLESDLLISLFIFLFVFAIHVSTVFSSLKPVLNDVLFCLAIIIGVFNHYLLPHLRIENPWHIFSQPLLKPDHWSMFEPTALAHLRWFEVIHVVLMFIEKNILNILVILSSLTISSDNILIKFEPIDPNGFIACLVISMISMKLLRHSFCEPAKQFKIFLLAYLFNKFDSNCETILFDLFFISIFLSKLIDLIDKLSFIYVYTAPWQLPWGSAFHAFAQPLSVPHSALLILQAVISSVLGTPLMPLMGSAIFLLSYMRPVKFWEKNYKTKRLDNSNTRLQSQFEATTADSENLNAIFYEHLTSVLQNSLCGDIMLGRWGQVHYGDFFVLSSDYLNCLVHIIEIGNGFVTFQLRGLEFKGTYCQQRELEAITEDNTENEGCCCCSLGHLKYMLSFNVSFHLRWVAWSVVARKYIVNAYRIVDNDLSLIVNFFSLRRTLIDFYIKSSIYYLIKSPKLIEWLQNENIAKELDKLTDTYIDYDCCFDSNLDTDYDTQLKGVTLAKFSTNFIKWVNHCKHQNLDKIKKGLKENDSLLEAVLNDGSNSLLVKLSFALSLVCRRALNSACTGASSSIGHIRKSSFGADLINSNHPVGSTNPTTSNLNTSGIGNGLHSTHLDSDSLALFQHGYYTLFKGDIRIQSPKDEWVFNDMEILKQIVIPAVRMGLRLHQDHFQNDSNDEQSLFENLTKFERETVISYERDPIWRYAVLNSVQSLLSLRHQFTEYSDQYKVVMLNKNYLSFRLIKLNKECVRSFWAGQQHELIFLRNKNQERGSIQNAKQVLRNIINSSCDQPIGYPIYVSPLTTSYSSTHPQICQIIGPEFRFKNVYNSLIHFFNRIKQNCTNNCSGSSNESNLFQCERNNRPPNLNVTYTVKPDVVQINMNQLSASNNSQLLSTANKSNNQLNYAMATSKPKPNDKIVINLTSSPGQHKQSTTKSVNKNLPVKQDESANKSK